MNIVKCLDSISHVHLVLRIVGVCFTIGRDELADKGIVFERTVQVCTPGYGQHRLQNAVQAVVVSPVDSRLLHVSKFCEVRIAVGYIHDISEFLTLVKFALCQTLVLVLYHAFLVVETLTEEHEILIVLRLL